MSVDQRAFRSISLSFNYSDSNWSSRKDQIYFCNGFNDQQMSAELLNKDSKDSLSGLITLSELTDLKMSQFNTKMSFLVPLPIFIYT